MGKLSPVKQEVGAVVRGVGLSGAVLLAALAFAASQTDLAFRAETLYLGRMAALVAMAVAAARRPAVAVGALLLALVALWTLPGGTLRAAAVAASLALTFLTSLWPGTALTRGGPRTSPFLLATAAMAFFRPELLLAGASLASRLATFVVLPALVTLVWAIAARFELSRLVPVPTAVRGLLAAAGALLFFATAALASLPWLRPQPLRAALALLQPRTAGFLLVDDKPVVLSREFPSRDVELPSLAASELVFDTHLAHGAMLPKGTLVARFELLSEGGARDVFELLAGRDTGEWAAARADVRAAAPAPPPPPFRGAVSEDGTFFAQTYRARWHLPAARRARRLRVDRGAELPPDTEIVFLRAEIDP